jgi:hypothetical protein
MHEIRYKPKWKATPLFPAGGFRGKKLGILTKCKVKSKDKIHPRTGHEGPEGE